MSLDTSIYRLIHQFNTPPRIPGSTSPGMSITGGGGRKEGDISGSLLPNFIPCGGLALPDFPGLFEKSSFKMADSQSKNSNESILFRRNIDQYSLEESA